VKKGRKSTSDPVGGDYPTEKKVDMTDEDNEETETFLPTKQQMWTLDNAYLKLDGETANGVVISTST